jgi:ABC-type multidrug transport system fused ATPase/permease subunit
MSKNPIFYLTKTMWRFAQGNRPRVILYVALFVGANLISLLQPLAVAKALNIIQTQGINEATLSSILLWLLLLPTLDCIFWALHGPARVLEMRNAFLVRANYKQYLLSGTLKLPLEWHTDHHSGDTIDKVEKGTRALYQFSENGFQIIQAAAKFFGSLIALALFDWSSLIIVALIVSGVFYLVVLFDRRLVPQYRVLNHFENKISAKIYDALSNISTVVILRVEQLIERDIMQAIKKPLVLFTKNIRLNEWKWFSASMGAGSLQFLVLGLFITLTVYRGEEVLVGTIFALFSYTNRINDVFFAFAYLYSDIVRQRESVKNAEEIAQVFPTSIDQESQRLHQWNMCRVHHLHFSYDATRQDRQHLNDIEMSWRRGEKIAVIGESGSGKTTFLKIIRGLYTPSSGVVELDGKALSNGFVSMSEDIALIPQEPEIFATTIRDNITMGLDRTEEDILRYVALARFASVVKRLPHGLDSSVVEKGVNLSGGEKQRLALARGLMASEEKSILLLDESTSSVDASNELAIYEHIFEVYKDKTIIASIHRLHLLQMFDMIYVFDGGSIVAHGSFHKLLETSPLFREQWERYSKTHKN